MNETTEPMYQDAMACLRCQRMVDARHRYTYLTWSGKTHECACYECLRLILNAWGSDEQIEERVQMASAQREIAVMADELLLQGAEHHDQ